MPRLMIQVALSGAEPRRYRLNKQEVVLGRSPQADVVLDGEQVSRAHARLTWANGRWRLNDCNSANGVYLDRGGRGTPFLARNDLVCSGDQLYIGRYQVSILMDDAVPVDSGPLSPVMEADAPIMHEPGQKTAVTNRAALRDEMRQWIDSTPPGGHRKP